MKSFYIPTLFRDMYENEMRAKEEEYLTQLAKKDEILLTTVCEFEDKISELQEKNSVNNFDVPETPRVLNLNIFQAIKIVCFRLQEGHRHHQFCQTLEVL